jgi:hypothetical protein
MNGICKTLGCFFGPLLDPSDGTWSAIQVYRDGNQITLESGFATEEEAEAFAGAERERLLQDNSQFGVGA